MRSQSTLIGLLIGVSLAAGYLTGRIHGDLNQNALLPISQPGLHDGYQHIEPDIREEPALRSRLNPSQAEVTIVDDRNPRTAQTAAFSHYTQAAQTADGVSHSSQKRPHHIGDFIDPDLDYEAAGGPPRHIGAFLDPDDPWPGHSTNNQANIGEFLDPDSDTGF